MRTAKLNDEVLVAADSIVKLKSQFIKDLKKKSKNTPRKRIRLNIHKNLNEPIHEMFIVHTKSSYIRPHKHTRKNESLHVLEGTADIIFFDAKGKIVDVFPMSDYTKDKIFYYKLTKPWYHTLLVKSDYLVFQEVANGPYKQSDNIFAPWSPAENDVQAIKQYMNKLTRDIENFLTKSKKKL